MDMFSIALQSGTILLREGLEALLILAMIAAFLKRSGASEGQRLSVYWGGGAAIVALVTVALLVFVQLFIVRWLWNTVLVRTVSIVRPLPDLWYTLGFLVLMAMIHPSTVAVTAN